MTDTAIYRDIASRTGGNIYIGVVGPVRTGKSSLIKRFADKMLLPVMKSESLRDRARDEMPQSASGRTVMTTEPKFIPEEAVEVSLDGNATVRFKLIDCVGYVIPGAMGLTEDGNPRMLMTPWSDSPMPFDEAAEIGTHKVIADHATVGIVVTTDGSITDLPRENYIAAEKRVTSELTALEKPYVIVLNSVSPSAKETIETAARLEKEYGVPVIPLSCPDASDDDLRRVLEKVLMRFPITEVKVAMPKWINTLGEDDDVRRAIYDGLAETVHNLKYIGDINGAAKNFAVDGGITASVRNIDAGTGSTVIDIKVPDTLFYEALGKYSGFEIDGEQSLMQLLTELAAVKKEYDRIKPALDEVERTGYGIVTPDASRLHLEEPEIVKQPGGYGVKLKASAPSIHMIRAEIETEVNPIVGTEKQSEAMIQFLLKEFEEDPKKIWKSDMFGKSLHEVVTEGLNNKLSNMPEEARGKMCDTLQKIINEGSGGLICILL